MLIKSNQVKPVKLPNDFDFEKNLALWQRDASGIAIERNFVFKDFQQAFDFMILSAKYAEEINHHPDWSNSWNRVNVRLCTHSENALTLLDVELAKAMDGFAIQVQV
jgi:4a-hydroxytetrahydrobiopterin dehydratase